jgi:hypothetical protein
VEGVLKDGSRVNVYRKNFFPPIVSKPLDGSGYFQGYRWRKYYSTVDLTEQWPRLSRYYCRVWNLEYPQTPVERVIGLVFSEQTKIGVHPGEAQWLYQTDPLPVTQCNEPLSQVLKNRTLENLMARY